MRWLKPLISIGLLVAAVAIALATAFSGHTGDYGKVPLPQGGTVHLPAGKIVVYYDQPGSGSDSTPQVSVPFAFQVVPAGGGTAVPVSSENGAPSPDAVPQSQHIGELRA